MSETPKQPAPEAFLSTIAGPGLPPLDADYFAPQELATAIVATINTPKVPTMQRLGELREVYWQNVTREMLVAFSLLANSNADITDGRVSIMTSLGERIPVAGVEPLFPCSVVDDPKSRELCIAVQCTVFNIRTPVGEIVTLPLHEIISVRVLSDELLKQLETAATGAAKGGQGEPFGFAAYTSLARQPQNQASERSPEAH